MTTRTEATDIMMGHVRAMLPLGVAVVWPMTPAIVPENTLWIRPSIQHVGGGQASLSGAIGTRRFDRYGMLTIQCFSPVGDGNTDADDLAGSLLNSFESIRNSQVWYRNIRAIEIGKEGSTVQVNLIADFSYEEIH